MKKITILLVMLFTIIILSWGCTGLTGEIGSTGSTGLTGENGIDYIPSEKLEAIVTLTNWVHPYNPETGFWDLVYLRYTIENIGLVDIDYYEIIIIIVTVSAQEEYKDYIFKIVGSDIPVDNIITRNTNFNASSQEEAYFVAILDYNLYSFIE